MLMRILFYVLVLGLAFLIYVRLLERSTLFLPSRVVDQTPADAGLAFQEMTFSTEDGVALQGWWVPAPADPGQAATIVFLHGNAGNIGDRIPKLAMFHRLGANVFIFDYRGYGRSRGRPTERGMYRDALAAYDAAVSQAGARADRLVVYGASLGGVAATYLAAQRPVAGLILDSTFTSAVDMARIIVPWIPTCLISIQLDSLGRISQIRTPKLFIHSPADETVPYRLGRKLFDAAVEPKQFLTVQGGHNDGYLESEEIFTAGIAGFLRQVIDQPVNDRPPAEPAAVTPGEAR